MHFLTTVCSTGWSRNQEIPIEKKKINKLIIYSLTRRYQTRDDKTVAVKKLIMILITIFSIIAHLLSAAAMTTIVAVMVRPDLVAGVVARARRTRSKPDPAATEWTDELGRVADVGLPDTVQLQVLVNRLHRFRSEHFERLDKRLEALEKKLQDVVRATHRARTAQRYFNTRRHRVEIHRSPETFCSFFFHRVNTHFKDTYFSSRYVL